MVDIVGVYATDERCFICQCRKIGQQLLKLHATLTVLLKAIGRSKQVWPALNESKPLALNEFRWNRLAIVLVQFWLGVEQI